MIHPTAGKNLREKSFNELFLRQEVVKAGVTVGDNRCVLGSILVVRN